MSSLAIYNEYFGLQKRPFTLLPDPDFIYWSTPHKQAYTMLEYGLLTCAPITLITGEIGSGKTTLLRELLKSMPSEYNIGLISNAQGDRGELLHWVLMSLGQPVERDAGYVHLFHQFQEYLITQYADGHRTVLIFDEAQNLSIETLEELRMFSNINADTDELLQLILVGQPQLCDLVSAPELVQFAQRIAAEFHLPTMSAEEVEKYINHRLEVAGATRRLFTRGACESIHLVSKGTPRLINQICDYALVYAYSYERNGVDAAVIQQVIEDRKIYGAYNSTDRGAAPFNTDDVVPLAEPEPPIEFHEHTGKSRHS
jgi:type II secretory pathway predicted ATPase ExeA